MTSIGGGENKGRTLQHSAVVRELKAIGETSHGSFDGAADVPTGPDSNAGKLGSLVLCKASTRERFWGQQLLLINMRRHRDGRSELRWSPLQLPATLKPTFRFLFLQKIGEPAGSPGQ